MRQRSLGVQALALTLSSAIAQVLVAILYIVTARNSPPHEYGVLATAIALGMAGAGFVDLGATLYWIRELASGRINQDELNARMSARVLAAFAIAAVVIAVALWKAPQFAPAGLLLFTTSTVMTVLVPCRAARRADYVGWLTVLDRAVAVIVFFTQIAIGIDARVALWTSIAAGDLLLVVCALATTSNHAHFRFRFRRLSNPWAGAKWYSLSTLGGSAQQLDITIVNALAGAAAAGIYGAVNRWIQPMVVAIASFASAAAPFLAEESNLRSLRGPFLRAIWILSVPLVISVGVIFAAPWLVVTLLGEQYAASAAVLQWLAAAMILNVFSQPLIVALQSRRFDHLAAAILLASVGAQLISVAALAPTLGAISAGVGFFVSQTLQVLGVGSCIGGIILWRRKNSVP